VLIVEDSPLISDMFEAMLNETPDIRVVGKATDGQEGLRMAVRLHPDIVTMDIRMPKMDGLEATRRIMALSPVPIIVVTSSAYSLDTNTAFTAIEAGALTVIEKPKGLGGKDYESIQSQLISTIRTMADVKVIGRTHFSLGKDSVGPMTAMLHDYFTHPVRVVAIAASTGGPPVLMQLFSQLPKDFSIPILVVQHILPPFVGGLVEWMNSRSALPLSIAVEGTRIQPGNIYLAPGDTHMTIGSGGLIRLDQTPPIHLQRPSATRLFESVARIFGNNAVGVILTGMGEDGVDGLEKMSKAGAHIIAQNEASSVVFGMPKAAINRHLVDEVLAPEDIVIRLNKLHRHMQSLG
jgi:two-component system chemotaxis response regulator CheB